MKSILKRITIGLFLTALLPVGALGCKNTAHGAGKDIENVGEKIQEKTN